MSTLLLVAKERQLGSPFGLGQKQAKNKKIRRKCATVARYSMLYRFLCTAMQRDGVQPGPDLAFGLCCSVPFTTTVGTASIHHAQASCYACPKCTLLLYCTQQKQRGFMIKEDTHSRPVTLSGLERARLALAISAGKLAGASGRLLGVGGGTSLP